MITVSDEITVRRPVEQVFDFLANLENAPQWQSELFSSKIVSAGPIGKGARFEEVFRMLGRKVVAICEISEYEPPRKLSYRSISSSLMDFEGRFVFEPIGQDTRIVHNSISRLHGLLRLMEPFARGEIKRGSAAELQKLKAVLEQ